MKARTRLSTKGQVVIPESVRRARGWKPGTELVVEEDDSGVRLRSARAGVRADWFSLIGCGGYRGPQKTLEEMDAAIMREAKRHK